MPSRLFPMLWSKFAALYAGDTETSMKKTENNLRGSGKILKISGDLTLLSKTNPGKNHNGRALGIPRTPRQAQVDFLLPTTRGLQCTTLTFFRNCPLQTRKKRKS